MEVYTNEWERMAEGAEWAEQPRCGWGMTNLQQRDEEGNTRESLCFCITFGLEVKQGGNQHKFGETVILM